MGQDEVSGQASFTGKLKEKVLPEKSDCDTELLELT